MKPVLPGGDSEAGSEAQRRGIAPEPIGLSNRRRPIGCVMGTGSVQSSRRLRVGFHRPSAKQGITNARRHETWNDCTAPEQETLLVERKTVGTKLWIWQRLGCLERDDRVRI